MNVRLHNQKAISYASTPYSTVNDYHCMLLNNKYKKLLPTKDYLIDEVVLLNAWKKSHQHIRGVNWYVDYLDLDMSALELESRIKALTTAIDNKILRLTPLQLIPAPKSHPWTFIPPSAESATSNVIKWEPNEITPKVEGFIPPIQPLRPLAHVSIDDQTLFTALMMLLASNVETKQGDPSTGLKKVHDNKVINYGNRLHCTYRDDHEATYSWGNSNTYSKYFQDYQQFLARPIYFGREANKIKTNEEQIYEVHLDFAKFYDSINRVKLLENISELVQEMTGSKPDDYVQHVLDQFLDWKWTKKSKQLYASVCRNEDIPKLKNRMGIPQGLVAGGFFANLYLLKFDEKIFKLIGEHFASDNEVILVDACRYVDDLRLIVKAKKKPENEKYLTNLITEEFKTITTKLGINLNLQETKTKVKVFSSKEGAISAKLADIQSKVSGPLPLHEIDEQLGHLEGLVELSDNLEIDSVDQDNIKFDLTAELAFIDKTFNDVRKDSLLRFTANKIHTLLRQKRNMIAQDVNDDGQPISGSWDYLQERMARKLVHRWTKDPSLVLLMKKGLELFPHVNLLRPILHNLNKLRESEKPELVLFAEYCLSEVLRHSASAIHTKDRWAFPAHSDPEAYFEYLSNYATSLLPNLENVHDALSEQAIFFCLIRNESALEATIKNKPLFNLMTQLLNGFRYVNTTSVLESEFSTAVLLTNQVSLDSSKVHKSIVSTLDTIHKLDRPKAATKRTQKLNKHNLLGICERILLEDPKLFENLYNFAIKQDLDWHKSVRNLAKYLGLTDFAKVGGKLPDYNGRDLSLLSVIRREDNPFKQENGILKLLQAVFEDLNSLKLERPIDIANTTINCSDWDNLISLDSSCSLSINIKLLEQEAFFHTCPDWLTDAHRPLYVVGMFVRSCLLGSLDWSRNLVNESINKRPSYRGIKSNMLKRQVGMMHAPEAFGDSKSAMSNWLSSLLFKLLQWPGVDNSSNGYEWPSTWNLEELERCVSKRLDEQSKGFCKLSNTPTYVEKVSLGWDNNKTNLNVAMIQPLLPLEHDFDAEGWLLNTPHYRAKHRRHLASVTELLLHNIASVDSANEKPTLKGKVDLIVWPELAVSPDDLDILERLSDKTGAIIFAGIGFSHIQNARELNNAAIWIIPNQKSSGRRFIKRLQGKWNMTTGEKSHITPWRPYQLIVELVHPAFKDQEGFKLTGSICYDATDIKLSADLKEKSHAYIISAMNKDIATFDSMVDALFYHMYQHVVLVNSGEFGGSVAKAPYKERYHKLITHTHGSHQVSISTFEMNMFDFRKCGHSMKSNKKVKTPPAGNII